MSTTGMQTISGTTGKLLEFISQDVSTNSYRQIVVTRMWTMTSDGKSPDLTSSIPDPGFPGGLTGIIAGYNNGIAKIDYYFEGERHSDVESDYVMSAEGSLSTEPITSHPYAAYLVANYAHGMRDGKILWNDYVAQGGSNGSDQSGNQVSNINPYSNVDSFLSAGMTYSISQTFSTPPNLNLESVGKICQTPPFGNLPQMNTKYGAYPWLYAGFSIEQHGSVYEVTLHYLLGALGGWLDDIYNYSSSSI
jgi:hypothetical protein